MRPGGRFAQWQARRPRYVVSDVDGTLLDAELYATAVVARAIHRVQSSGIPVGVATGRAGHGAAPVCAQLDLAGPHVFHNGAQVVHGDEVVGSWCLTAGQVDALIAFAAELDDAYVELYTDETFFVTTMDRRAQAHWEMIGSEPAGLASSAATFTGTAVLKATLVAFGVTQARLATLIQAVATTGLAVGPSTSPRTPELAYLNLTHPDADKGAALRRAAQAVGVDQEEVMALGDGLNDVPLLLAAGTAVAMGQAPPAVIDAAHLVVPSVADDGAAVAVTAVLDWWSD